MLSKQVRWVNELLCPIVTMTAGVRQIFCENGEIANAGTRQYNLPFANFLEAIARDSDDALAAFRQAMVTHFGPTSGGLITAADLENYRPQIREPLRTHFGDFEILTNPPPASGGGLIAFALKLVERSKLGEFQSASHLIEMAEIFRAVSLARLAGYDANISDPGTIEGLLEPANVDRWIHQMAARKEERQLGGTTHISVIDVKGGAASLTASNGEGSGHVLPDMGIHVNNFLGEEDINPLGFHKFVPGSWMTTMMSPTVVLKGGSPVLVLGSGGSNRIRSAVTSALVNSLHFGVDLDTAVNAPRLHVEGDKLWFEADDNKPEAYDELQSRWTDASRFSGPNMFFGGVHATARLDSGLVGGGDKRRGGAVAAAGDS